MRCPVCRLCCWGDRTRLQQALLNYAGNAIKFTERGAVTMRARILAEDEQSVLIRFEVEDTGIVFAPRGAKAPVQGI